MIYDTMVKTMHLFLVQVCFIIPLRGFRPCEKEVFS